MPFAPRLATLALAIAALTLLALPCAAAVKKCTDSKGRVTYQDGQCPVEARAASAAAPVVKPLPAAERVSSAPLPTTAGPAVSAASAAGRIEPVAVASIAYAGGKDAWRGPAQFQVQPVAGAASEPRSTAGIVIEFGSDGRVSGAIDAAGCKLSGAHKAAPAPGVANVELTLTGCRDVRVNARYNGTLDPVERSKDLKMTLQSAPAPAAKPAAPTLIEVVLRR